MMWCFSGMSISIQKHAYVVPAGLTKPPGTTMSVRTSSTRVSSLACGGAPPPMHLATSSGGTVTMPVGIGMAPVPPAAAIVPAAPLPARGGMFTAELPAFAAGARPPALPVFVGAAAPATPVAPSHLQTLNVPSSWQVCMPWRLPSQ